MYHGYIAHEGIRYVYQRNRTISMSGNMGCFLAIISNIAHSESPNKSSIQLVAFSFIHAFASNSIIHSFIHALCH